MTRAQFLTQFPKASADTLARNAALFNWPPEPKQARKRRTLAAIVTEDLEPLRRRGEVVGSFTRFLALPIVSEANQREHWSTRATRTAHQKLVTGEAFACLAGFPKPRLISFCRVGRNAMDSDNLAGAFKHVRDQLATILGFNDRDPSVVWLYNQVTDSKGILGFTVVIVWGKTGRDD